MILKQIFIAGFISGASLLLSTLMQFLLAKKLGVEAYGTFSYGWTVAITLSSLFSFGLIQTSLQYIPKYLAKESKPYVNGYVAMIERYLFLFLVPLVTLLFMAFLELVPKLPNVLSGIQFFVFFAVFLTATSIFSVITRCLNGSFFVLFFEKVNKELLMIFALLVMLFFEIFYTYEIILKLLSLFSLISMVGSYLLMKRRLYILNITPNKVKAYKLYDWFNSAKSFVLINVFYILLMRIDFFLLPIWWDAKELGLFSIALRLTEFISFGLFSLHLVTLPMIAKAYRNKKLKEMKNIINITIIIGGVSGLFITLLLFFEGESMLILINPDFLPAYSLILLMLLPQLFRAIDATSGNLLNIVGSHEILLKIAISTFILKLMLSLFLIKDYGAAGAAWSTGIALVFSILGQSWFINKQLNFPIGLSGNILYRLKVLQWE